MELARPLHEGDGEMRQEEIHLMNAVMEKANEVCKHSKDDALGDWVIPREHAMGLHDSLAELGRYRRAQAAAGPVANSLAGTDPLYGHV